MECPSCSNGCLLDPSEGGNDSYCPQCEGVWIEEETLNAACQSKNLDQFALRALLKQGSRRTNTRRCPNCIETLSTTTIKEIELDWCESCNGVWFDSGEYRRLLEYSGDISNSDKAMSVIVLVEFIGAVISGLT